ncbi:MAG TPA: hypothetical protein VG457_04085, partial [Planctomycetota bacterium]|nr:hypothetical protein [Planctomycetota bacterium]
TRRYVVQPGVPTLHWWGREKFRDLRRWAKDKMEARFNDLFYHMSILHAGVLPPPLLKRELDFKITEELRRPPDRPKDDHHHKKDDKKHAAAAPHGHPKGHEAHAKAKPVLKKLAVPKKKPAPKAAARKKPKPAPRTSKKAPTKKKKRS